LHLGQTLLDFGEMQLKWKQATAKRKLPNAKWRQPTAQPTETATNAYPFALTFAFAQF
jgi:hypothetical protein